MKLDFLVRLPCRQKDSGMLPNAPALDVTLKGPGGTISLLLEVDTGAERTVLSGEHCRELGLDLFEGPPINIGLARGGFEARLHRVEVRFEMDPASAPAEWDPEEYRTVADLAFATGGIPRAVMGRDLLRTFTVALDEEQGLLYLGPRGQSAFEL